MIKLLAVCSMLAGIAPAAAQQQGCRFLLDNCDQPPSEQRVPKPSPQFNARAVQYYCGSVPAYEQGIKDGTTSQQSLDTVRRMCHEARAGKLTVDQFGRPFQ